MCHTFVQKELFIKMWITYTVQMYPESNAEEYLRIEKILAFQLFAADKGCNVVISTSGCAVFRDFLVHCKLDSEYIRKL